MMKNKSGTIYAALVLSLRDYYAYGQVMRGRTSKTIDEKATNSFHKLLPPLMGSSYKEKYEHYKKNKKMK
jgi:hypothetical protein